MRDYTVSGFKKTFVRQNLLTLSLALVACGVFAQPKANFSASPVSGCAPLVVNFTDQSTGSPTTWKWDLGNGVTSTLQNPSTTYFSPGIYTVKLIVVNAAGKDSLVQSNFINILDPPQVAFSTVSPVSGCFPLRVQFLDNSSVSSGSITQWSWDFGDGTTSTSQNPYKIYTTAGNYNVALKVTSSNGCSNLLVKPGFIKATNGVKADFSASNPVNCKPPELITFTNLSTGPGTLTYNWSFGDGGTSTNQNPSHTYTTASLYSVQLIVNSDQGCVDTIRKDNSLSIGAYQSNFITKDSICLGDTLKIQNTSLPDPPASTWYFGDGTTSFSKNPAKVYGAAGTYTIKLVNNYGACLDSAAKQVAVINSPIPVFSAAQTTSCSAPFATTFTDATPGATQWLWDFGDGSTSTLQNPSHTYNSFNQFTVTLTVTNSIGCKGTTTKTNYIQIAKPVITVTGLPGGGCAPFTFTPVPAVTTAGTVSSWLWDFGDGTTSTLQNPTKLFVATGSYTIKLFITTSGGCTDSLIVPNGVLVGTKPTPAFTASPLSACVGQSIQFTDQSTGNPNEWYWDFGDKSTSGIKNPVHSFNKSGTFTVKLIAYNNKCADSIIKVNYITILPPEAYFSVKYDCNSSSFIALKDSSIGATGWSWNFGDGTTSTLQNPTHTYAAGGIYSITLTVTNGSCSNTVTQTIRLKSQALSILVDKNAKCKSDAFSFSVPVTVASGILSYIWDLGNGYTTNAATFGYFYPATGTYKVTLIATYFSGCNDTTSITVNAYGPKASFSIAPNPQCTNQDVAFTNTSATDGTNAITSALWDFGDGTAINNLNPVVLHKYALAGSYTGKLKVTDAYGCSDSISNPTIINILKSSIDFTVVDTLTCPGGAIQFNNNSIGNNLSYSWNFGDGTTSTAKNPLHTYTAPGKYKVVLVGMESIGCIDSMVKQNYITVDVPKASFNVSDSFTICPPLQVQFTNTSTFYKSVQWSFGDGNTSAISNPKYSYSIPGVYSATLIVTSPGGCVDSIKKVITVLSNTKGVLTYNPLSGCYPQQIDFKISSTNPVKYFWDFGDGATLFSPDSIQKYQYGYPGFYVPKVTMQDAQGCLTPVFGADTIKIFGAKADFGLDKSLFCDAGTVQFRDSTFTSDAISSVLWSFGDGSSANNIKSPSHFYTSPGLYTVSLTVNTTNGCTNTMAKPALIKVVKSPQINISGATTYCSPATAQLNGTFAPDTSSLSWKWDINNTIINQQNTGPVSLPNAGTYPVTLTAVNSSGCSVSVNTSITVNQTPTIDAGNDTTICLGNSFMLQPTGGASYVWSPATYLSCTSCINPVSAPVNNIRYYVTGTSAQQCSNKDSITIKVKKPFNISAKGDASICVGKSVQLSVTGAENYSWSPANGLSNPAISNPIANPSISTTYQVIGFDSSFCFYDTAFVQVDVFNYPTIDIGKDTAIMGGTSIQLNPVASNDIISWLWSASPSGTLNCYACPAPIAKPVMNSTYTVEVKNSIGCATTDQINIIVLCSGGKIYLPNAFTPNNDGRNDWFYVIGNGVQTIKTFQIFDRWGKIIFDKRNILANSPLYGWNGQLNGVDLPTGVYPYTIEVICGDGALFKLNGSVTLIR